MKAKINYLFFAAIAAIFVAMVSSAAIAQTSVKYNDLEKEAISQDSGNILEDYFGSVIGRIGNNTKFNTIATKDNIAIINLTVDGKDRRILARLTNGITYGLTGNYNLNLTQIGQVDNLTVIGNLAVSGFGYYNISTDFGERKFFGLAGTSPSFIDEGVSRLFNGISNVSINPVFGAGIDDYKVYLSPEGKTKGIYVSEKTKDYFIVKGFNPNSNIKFSWMVSGLRKQAMQDSLKDYEINALVDYESGTTQLTTTQTNISSNNNQAGIHSTETDEIIQGASSKFGLSNGDVKSHIKFAYKEPQGASDEQDTQTQSESYQTPKSYIEVNGSVIIKLG